MGYSRVRPRRAASFMRVVLVVPTVASAEVVRDVLDDGIDVVARAGTSTRALELERMHEPDAVVVALAGETDLAIARQLVRRRGRDAAPIIMVGPGGSDIAMKAALELGTAAVAVSSAPRQVERARSGARHGDNDIPTARELEILRLAARGMSNAQIARQLWVSDETVKSHLASVYRKLGAGGRRDAAEVAERLGYLEVAG